MTDDLTLIIETTWLEDSGTGYDRVIVFNFFTEDLYSSMPSAILRTVGKALRSRIINKLLSDVGIAHKDDYIFAVYDNPKLVDGKWTHAPIMGDQRIVIRLQDEEHFTMLKMHYGT